jgi:hypothetical protein
VPVGGLKPGDNLAGKFRPLGDGVWEWKLDQPLRSASLVTLDVSVRDRQGNEARVMRSFRTR